MHFKNWEVDLFFVWCVHPTFAREPSSHARLRDLCPRCRTSDGRWTFFNQDVSRWVGDCFCLICAHWIVELKFVVWHAFFQSCVLFAKFWRWFLLLMHFNCNLRGWFICSLWDLCVGCRVLILVRQLHSIIAFFQTRVQSCLWCAEFGLVTVVEHVCVCVCVHRFKFCVSVCCFAFRCCACWCHMCDWQHVCFCKCWSWYSVDFNYVFRHCSCVESIFDLFVVVVVVVCRFWCLNLIAFYWSLGCVGRKRVSFLFCCSIHAFEHVICFLFELKWGLREFDVCTDFMFLRFWLFSIWLFCDEWPFWFESSL